jgi:mono/diheme cytochrome c family protein
MNCVVRGLRWIALAVVVGATLGSASLVAQDPPADAGSMTLVGNRSSKTFHKSTCATLKRLSAKAKISFESVDDAVAKGYKPCPTCKPAGDDMPAAKAKTNSKKGQSKGSSAKAAPAKSADPAPAADDKTLKFSRDIAPILVGNCISCHNPAQRRGKFDLTTFEKLMKGADKEKVISPGKPDESHLILRLRGEETPKMPPGQRTIAPEAIAKIEAWVKAGALLDAGIEPTAELEKVAPTPEMLRRAELARMAPEERDKKAEAAGMERWRKANSKVTPVVTSDKHFLVFGNLPADRVKPLLKAMEAEYETVGRILGPAAAPALAGPEKISIYVFNDRNSYVEFVRGNESREVDDDVSAHGNLAVESPYLAALDPLGGHDDPFAGAAKKGAGKAAKRDEENTSGGDRSLIGLLAEQLGVSAASQSGKPPRWLTLGLGAYLGSRVEPRSPYYRKLRAEAGALYVQGWSTKAQECLGGEGDANRVRAVGLSLMEWLSSTARQAFTPFIREMLDGGERLDPTIQGIFGQGVNRDAFLQEWGGWVATHYGRGR